MKILIGIGVLLLIIGNCAAIPASRVEPGVPTITRKVRRPQIFTDAFIRAAIAHCAKEGKHIEGLVCHIPEGCAVICKKEPSI